MRACFTFSLLFLVLLCTPPIFAAETIEGKVVSVADGDTLTVLKGKEQVKVRLHGVDAPEKAQDFGTASRTFTSEACFGKEVTVEVKDTDRYGRKVGIVTLPDGRVLNHELVKAGLAHWYAAYARFGRARIRSRPGTFARRSANRPRRRPANPPPLRAPRKRPRRPIGSWVKSSSRRRDRNTTGAHVVR